MTGSRVIQTRNRIVKWVETRFPDKVTIEINECPEANVENYDYFINCEIKISPLNRDAMPVTFWLSEDGIGYAVGNFSIIAKLIGASVGKRERNYPCAFVELSYKIDRDKVLQICESVASAEMEITGIITFGKLKGIESRIYLDSANIEEFSIGQSTPLVEILALFGLSKRVKVPYCKW